MNKKVVLLSGGCGLLGKEFAKTLSLIGYTVVVLDLHDKITENLSFISENCLGFFSVDITNEEDVEIVIELIYDNYGRIDILINCAAINFPPKEGANNSFEIYSLDKWNKTLSVNLTGAFLLSRECIKYMLKNTNEG